MYIRSKRNEKVDLHHNQKSNVKARPFIVLAGRCHVLSRDLFQWLNAYFRTTLVATALLSAGTIAVDIAEIRIAEIPV